MLPRETHCPVSAARIRQEDAGGRDAEVARDGDRLPFEEPANEDPIDVIGGSAVFIWKVGARRQ